jgi:hypothetical protein
MFLRSARGDTSIQIFQVHIRGRHSSQEFQCQICSKIFKSQVIPCSCLSFTTRIKHPFIRVSSFFAALNLLYFRLFYFFFWAKFFTSIHPPPPLPFPRVLIRKQGRMLFGVSFHINISDSVF